MTPDQLRQARAILPLSAERLAARSGTTTHIVNEYERFGRIASKRGQSRDFDAVAAIRAALEAAGVQFVDENGGGLGVRLRRSGGEQ